jgi:exopolyphosphatase/guanosine-5'-triphosphate,3'-diphosphate pyrophosphatase
VRYACVDIGSNTTRLLIAEVDDAQWREVMTQRTFTRIGKGRGKDGRLDPERVAETVEVATTQVRLARELGAEDIAIVATEAVRAAPNSDEVAEPIERETGIAVRLLSGSAEARLSFVGATKRLGTVVEGPIAVIDVGGGSTEIAVGTAADGADWDATFRVGSGKLAESYLSSDPPGVGELEQVRLHVGGAFEGLEVPPAEQAVAVGGTASSLRRLVGAELDHETLERGIRILMSTPIEEVALRFDMEEERARILPAGMLILEELSDRIGLPLQIGNGGLREGVILSRLLEHREAA